MRRFLKSWSAGLIVGIGLLSGAMAGVGLGPVRDGIDDLSRLTENARSVAPARGGTARIAALTPPPAGQFLVGAGKVSIAPNPPAGEKWQTKGCQIFDVTNPVETFPDPSWDFEMQQTPWPQSPDCIYLGGYGIGPVRPANGVSPLGVWAKAVAFSDGTDVVIMGKIDAVGYFYRYDGGQCADCGIADIREALSKEFKASGIDVPAGNITFAASHSHGSADFLGGWGGVADWYLKQARDAMTQAARDAVASLRPAVVRTGDVVARGFNGERRDFYRSASDNQLVWIQATAGSEVVATIVNYAAHPTVLGSDNLLIHPDWPGSTEKRLEDVFGGVGMELMSGLGNQSDSAAPGVEGTPEAIGEGLANVAIADIPSGTTVPGGDVAADVEEFVQPVTNVPLGGLGLLGFFDRAFEPIPAAGAWGENMTKPCVSGSPVAVRAAMGAYKVGDVVLTYGPGEMFSNMTAAVKDELDASRQAMVVSLANDELGYLIQSFEFDLAGQQGLGFVGGIVEYEEAFSLDHCFGDRVTEGLIAHGKALGF
jgi:hypothetical protein